MKYLVSQADTLHAAWKAERGAKSTTAKARRRTGEGHDEGAGIEPLKTAATALAGAGESI